MFTSLSLSLYKIRLVFLDVKSNVPILDVFELSPIYLIVINPCPGAGFGWVQETDGFCAFSVQSKGSLLVR